MPTHGSFESRAPLAGTSRRLSAADICPVQSDPNQLVRKRGFPIDTLAEKFADVTPPPAIKVEGVN